MGRKRKERINNEWKTQEYEKIDDDIDGGGTGSASDHGAEFWSARTAEYGFPIN